MADISKITLPSGNTYDIKDATARQLISGGVIFSVAWDGVSTPVVANIPEGVVVTYSSTDYTGTMAAASGTMGTFYLVKTGMGTNKYDEYVTVRTGTSGSYTYAWEKLGTQEVDLSGLGSLAYKNSVTVNTGSGDVVLGEATTFTNASSSVTFSGGTTDTFVKSYPGATSKLVTTSVPNVTAAGSASTWLFAMGTGNDSETLIISGANSTAPTLGTAITAATGSLSATGSGDSVMTGLGTATTASAVTGIGTGTAAAQTITVGTNDKVTVAKKSDISASVS
jgi:hypothetical protein